jgi:hypothetical protein
MFRDNLTEDWRNVRATSTGAQIALRRRSNAHGIANHRDSAVDRCITHLAVQRQLGILPKWWRWISVADRRDSSVGGAFVSNVRHSSISLEDRIRELCAKAVATKDSRPADPGPGGTKSRAARTG